MSFDQVERLIHWLGGLLAYSALGIVLYGIWRGTRRQPGRKIGVTASWLSSTWFYIITTVLFLAACILGWAPLPLVLLEPARAVVLVAGCLLLFLGLGLALWGRLALGRNYFASTGLGVQLFEGHRLVTGGPYAFVRHPMYLGLILAAWGSLLVYHTWSAVGFALIAPFTLLRARREEAALAAEFGLEWQEYCRRVPPFFPRWNRRRQS